MALNLIKGQTEAISSSITKLRVGLGWEPNERLSNYEFDLDVSAFLLGSNGKVISDNHLVFLQLRIKSNCK